MKLESVVIDDDIAASVDRLWPDHTWSEVVEFALSLAVADAVAADRDAAPLPDPAAVDALARSFAAAPADADADDLEQRIAYALGQATA